MPLPLRFKKYSELTEREREELFHRRHALNLRAADLKPVLRQRFSPVMKQHGFERIADGRWSRMRPPHYVHFLEIRFSGKRLGRFMARAAIALDFLPVGRDEPFHAKSVCIDRDCLLVKDLSLPHGDCDFDNGANLDEANETVDLLIQAFTEFERAYFARFCSFPVPVDQLDAKTVARLRDLTEDVLGFGRSASTPQRFIWQLALAHRHAGNRDAARELLEYGRQKHQLFALKQSYDALLAELSTLPHP